MGVADSWGGIAVEAEELHSLRLTNDCCDSNDQERGVEGESHL
jgi:hypothetical protein